MPTSGTYTFSVSRDDIIREAMLNLGKLGEAEVPTAQEVTDCARKLNMLVKQWMAKQDFAPGLKVWTRRHADMFLSNSTGTYNLGPSGDHWTNQSYTRTLTANASAAATALTVSSIANASSGDYIGIQLNSGALYWTTINGAPSGSTINITAGLPSAANSGAVVFNYTTKAQRPNIIEAVVLRDINFNDTPLKIYTLQEYSYQPSKQNPNYVSDPLAIYYEAQLTNGVLYTDVAAASDVTKRLRIDYLEPIQDFNNPLDTPEYPQEWYLALCWGLTQQIGPMFNLPFTKDMQQNMMESIAIAREAYSDRTAMFFQPGIE